MRPRQLLLQARESVESFYTRYPQRLYFGLFGHRVERKFAIVSTARTGSNYLSGGLRTSPSVRMYHEIFADHNRQIGKDFEKTFAMLCQPESKSTQIVGFKVFYNHLTDDEWRKLAAQRDLQIIHLTRRNRLKTVISLEIAFRTGRWTKSSRGSTAEEKRLLLDPALLMQRLEQIEAGEAATRLRFSDRPVLEVVYEDIVSSPREGFHAVGQYLGMSNMDPDKIKLKKQNPEPLQQLISNFHEIEALLKHTRFAEYLYL